jgi:lactate permease
LIGALLVLWGRGLERWKAGALNVEVYNTFNVQRSTFDLQPSPLRVPLWRAALPYVALTVLLLVSRLVVPLREWLQQTAVLRVPELGLTLPLLYSPGFWVLLAAGVAVLAFSTSWSELRAAAGRAWQQFLPGAAAVAGFLAAAQVMTASGMVALLAGAVAGLGVGYVWLAPWLGALGGWLTGSNVGSNAMFAALQQSAGAHAGLPIDWLIGAQNSAGSHATMISPTRLTIAATAAGIAGAEGRLLRIAGPVVLVGLVAITVLLAAFVYVFMIHELR